MAQGRPSYKYRDQRKQGNGIIGSSCGLLPLGFVIYPYRGVYCRSEPPRGEGAETDRPEGLTSEQAHCNGKFLIWGISYQRPHVMNQTCLPMGIDLPHT